MGLCERVIFYTLMGCAVVFICNKLPLLWGM